MTYQSMGLATLAGVFALALAPLPTANADLVTDTVSFNYEIYGPVPGIPVENWFIKHDFDLTYDSSSGLFQDETINVDFTFVVGGEEFTVDGTYQRFAYGDGAFEASIEIPEAPFDYGPMTLEFGGGWDTTPLRNAGLERSRRASLRETASPVRPTTSTSMPRSSRHPEPWLCSVAPSWPGDVVAIDEGRPSTTLL